MIHAFYILKGTEIFSQKTENLFLPFGAKGKTKTVQEGGALQTALGRNYKLLPALATKCPPDILGASRPSCRTPPLGLPKTSLFPLYKSYQLSFIRLSPRAVRKGLAKRKIIILCADGWILAYSSK